MGLENLGSSSFLDTAIHEPKLVKNKVFPEPFSVQNFSSSKWHESKTVPIQRHAPGMYYMPNFGLGASTSQQHHKTVVIILTL